MKKVFIKYNPYKLETEITVDGKKLAQNSKLGEKITEGSRLQEWVEELPDILVDEYNDNAFEVIFHGTLIDYEDVAIVLNRARDEEKIKVELKHKPAKETSDKESLIDNVFEDIQKGPFEELKTSEIISAFENAKSSDFEVCVVATMSAGKSTLINAMLGTKLMPSCQEACTAIITKIKDCSQHKVPFKAEVCDKEGKLCETHENLTYSIMERLNSDKNNYTINVFGNIPFVSSDDISLVLIDTPGPNNSRDPEHKKVQSELLGKSSKALVLYIMTGEFGTDDDDALLHRVAESMRVKGKQSKDRFIFVVNKLDDRKKEDGDIEQTLKRVKSYLSKHGISNPNLFPASALAALNIRLIENSVDLDEETLDETEFKIKKLNRDEKYYFDKYAPLPPSIKGEINSGLDIAQLEWVGEEIKNPKEALIHTGVVSIEAAIRQYVEKYAKTAKIKNIADVFMHKLNEVGCYEKTKSEIAKHQNDSQKIINQIEAIKCKMDSAYSAKKFKDTVDDAIATVDRNSIEIVEDIIQKLQSRITKRIDALRNQEILSKDADEEVNRLLRFAKDLEPEFEVDLNELVRDSLVHTSMNLIESYKQKLVSLADEIELDNIEGVVIDPLKLMEGSCLVDNFSVASLRREKKVKDGEEWVGNESKKWYKPWTWFDDSGYYRTKYKTVKYIAGDELAQAFFEPVQMSVYENGDSAREYALQKSKDIADYFNKEFAQLDDVLKQKLTELESYATDKEKAAERIEASERKLEWLKEIEKKVEAILEI